MMYSKQFFTALKVFFVLTILTGIIYPVLVTGFSQLLFTRTANGSLVYRGDTVVGSSLVAQKFESPNYFHARPSASDYATIPSGASNLGPTSKVLKDQIAKRQASLGANAPADLITTSASGLDPHISPAAAQFQVDRIASHRHLGDVQKNELRTMVERNTEPALFGFLGRAHVNVLALNLALDEKFP